MKTGILGGTFDPVHNGHILIAGETFRQLKLDNMIFVPAACSPFKTETCETPAEHRFKMVELAVEGVAGFTASRIELDRPGISYTIDTLEALQAKKSQPDDLYLITGLDSLRTLSEWKDAGRIITLCRLVTVCRPGYDVRDIDVLEQRLPGLRERLILLKGPLVDISSTDSRRRISAGESIHGLVPERVEAYIQEHQLYRKGK
ncbi:MAG: nicotinate-nucleotide adenylyltransferase [Dehalococcoidales bacterium]|nr:nicotinate-nucleotide adenylyltransferase [Dehalococcoidales bacterium]